MFEALFVRRLAPTGPFAAELKAAGYDLEAPQLKYPTEIWVRCLELARKHRWLGAPEREAYRQLGREFAAGFLETSSGQLIAVALPHMTPESWLSRLASYFKIGREDTGLLFDVVESREGFSRVTVHNPAEVPGSFVAGIVEVGFERLRKPVAIDVTHASRADYELVVRWQ
jgi:uncharacterized protein (TIGR02265 family)